MTSLRTSLLAAALLSGLGLAATAQTAAPAAGASAPAGRHHQFDPAKMQARFDAHMAALKQKLAITSAQEPAWTSFTTAMRPQANGQRPDRAAIQAMNTPDRIDHMRALRTQRIAEQDRRADATKAFYAQLSAEQKKTFDTEAARRHGGHGHGRMHG